MEISLSKIDEDRFGFKVAKAKLISDDNIDQMIAAAKTMEAVMVIIRISTNDVSLAQQLEGKGAILTDTLVYYQNKQLSSCELSLPNEYYGSSASIKDAEEVALLAAETFKDYKGHYHADSRLNTKDCDEVYTSWAKNSCLQGEFSDHVILIKTKKEIAAFATLKKLTGDSYEGVLFGVNLRHKNKRLHLNLMKLSQNWGVDNGLTRFVTSTQITNLSVQKNWCRVGMEPMSSFYTFHFWMK